VKVFGTILIVLGSLLIVVTGALFVSGEYERGRIEQELAAVATADAQSLLRIQAVATSQSTATATPVPAPPTPTPSVASKGTSVPVATITPIPPTVTPVPVPTATPEPAIIRRIISASIGLDAGVVAAPIRNGEWEVPKFVAGHLEGTAQPSQGGNVVLTGHVQSISSGNVFADIERLRPKDQVVLRTTRGDLAYVVRELKVVTNDDISVVQPTSAEILTLITCTGRFNPITRDYSHRTIVIAEPVL
jgi:sortase A